MLKSNLGRLIIYLLGIPVWFSGMVYADCNPKDPVITPNFKLPTINGRFLSWNCTDQSIQATCVAGGYKKNNSNFPSPALFESKDGGLIWEEVDINNMPAKGVFNYVNCSNNNNGFASCSALSEVNRMIAYSKNNFSNWKLAFFYYETDKKATKPARTVCCASNSKIDYCLIAGGSSSWSPERPFSIQTQDGGVTWKQNFDTIGVFVNSNCSGSNDQITAELTNCVVDFKHGNEHAYYYKTYDSGNSWNRSHVKI